jgi:preprotein translocase subunit YajC
MKLNYRDKIIAAFLIAIAILAISFFALIKPKYKDIKAHEKTLSEVQKTKQDIQDKIDKIPKLKESILKTQEDTNAIAVNFVPVNEVQNPVAIDKYMQKFAEDCHVKIKSAELSKSKVSPVDYYYGDNSDSIDEMRKSADIDGSLSKEYANSLAEQNSLSQRAKETVIQTQYGINVEGTKANIWKYLETLKKFEKHMLINSVSISDYTFGKKAAEDANVSYPESEEEATFTVGEGQEKKNTSDVKLVVTLYSVFEMPTPDVETIPAAEG